MDTLADIEALRSWQRCRLQEFNPVTVQRRMGPANVTALCYFFWKGEDADRHFPYIQCAIQETWRHCGMLKTVIVTNKRFRCVDDFAERYGHFVENQIEESLHPGQIDTMSADCNGKLHTRFSTDYVLIIQDDGFPLRRGLEYFLGKGDFIASPRCAVRDAWHVVFLRRIMRLVPFNGGFSLRTRRICRLAAEHWERKWKALHPIHETIEDVYYTTTLPRHSPLYRLSVRANDVLLGYRFAVESTYFPPSMSELPFGFHSARALRKLCETYPGLAGGCVQCHGFDCTAATQGLGR